MNREIKFRAWDQQAHDWNEKYSINAGGDHKPLPAMYDWEALKEYSMDALDGDSQFNIMQFSGLKDKNGVEIFEGDICKTMSVDGDSTDSVIFNNGCFCLDWPLWEYKSHQIEVIGNIYQHAHLLP